MVTRPAQCPTTTKQSSLLTSMLTAGAGSWCHAILCFETPSKREREQSPEAERNICGDLCNPVIALIVSPPPPSVILATLPLPPSKPASNSTTEPQGRPSATCPAYPGRTESDVAESCDDGSEAGVWSNLEREYTSPMIIGMSAAEDTTHLAKQPSAPQLQTPPPPQQLATAVTPRPPTSECATTEYTSFPERHRHKVPSDEPVNISSLLR